MRTERWGVVLSCEHGGARVPSPWKACFEGAEAVLASHRGWDPGALGLARALSRGLEAPLLATTVTRLLVEPNRSLGHPALFSEFTRSLPAASRDRLVELYWRPHRSRVEAGLRDAFDGSAAVLHVSVHSFTPVLDGKVRDVDLGLLYDPSRPVEKSVSRAWIRALKGALPSLRVRANAPYRGVSDGLTTHLRRVFPTGYLGVELEVNQAILKRGPAEVSRLAQALTATLGPSLSEGLGASL